jgi:hypothetical protein
VQEVRIAYRQAEDTVGDKKENRPDEQDSQDLLDRQIISAVSAFSSSGKS